MTRFHAVLCSAFAVSLFAATAESVQAPFSNPGWTIESQEHRIEQFDGRETLWMKGGGALLHDVSFKNGVIEFDVMVGTERGFSGARFRQVDDGNFESFYIRPHQSGNVDANQYQPVFNGVDGWQIYYGGAYSVRATYPAGEWISIKIEVFDGKARITQGGDTAVLVVDLVHEPAAGVIGIFTGWAPARFSNFRYKLTDAVRITDVVPAENDGPKRKTEGLIRKWSISGAIDEAALIGATELDTEIVDALEWHELGVESNGIANLARVQGLAKKANTALARIRLRAAKATVQRLGLGFSDRVRVYVNGRLVYSASDKWQSRDYRFLGTVGTYCAVYAPLEAGDNEIVLAVSESFGGWAVTGNLVPDKGVRVVD